MASGPITSWQTAGKTMDTVRDFIFFGSKITADGDCSHEIKGCLLPERKAMTNLAACCCQVASVVSNSVRPHGLQPTRLLRPWDSPGKNTGVGCHFLLQGNIPTQGLNPSPALQTDSLPAQLQGKPKNTGMGSLSLLQQIFLTQELNLVSCIAGGFFTN